MILTSLTGEFSLVIVISVIDDNVVPFPSHSFSLFFIMSLGQIPLFCQFVISLFNFFFFNFFLRLEFVMYQWATRISVPIIVRSLPTSSNMYYSFSSGFNFSFKLKSYTIQVVMPSNCVWLDAWKSYECLHFIRWRLYLSNVSIHFLYFSNVRCSSSIFACLPSLFFPPIPLCVCVCVCVRCLCFFDSINCFKELFFSYSA